MASFLPPFLLTLPRNPLFAIGLPLIAGSLSGYPTATVVRGEWYRSLTPPKYNPPRQAFGIVWPILYGCMGYASHLAIQAHDTALTPATKDLAYTGLALYYGQLVLNLSWTPLFFGLKRKGTALIDMAALLGMTGYMTTVLHTATAGKTTPFLAPYCAWLLYATYLNTSYFWNNRDVKGATPRAPPKNY